jgi:hypothetical protein
MDHQASPGTLGGWLWRQRKPGNVVQVSYASAASSLSGSNNWICTDGITVEIACL